jgi:purine-binding chemotaxis protein CheW
MNLADIRKKVEQERGGAARPHVSSGETVMKGDGRPEVPTVAKIEAVPGGAPEEVGAVPVTAPAHAQPAFDPLAVLLAGRETAGCGESFLDPTSDVPEPVDGESQEFLCFRVSSEKYAVNIMEIKEIIKPRELTEVPRVPPFISGVLSLRGVIIPVFNMRERLGLATAASSGKERIVVVKRGEEFCGIMVDEVIQVARIAAAAIEQPPSVLDGIDRDFVEGIGRFDGGMLILLNLENILDLMLC